MRVMSKRTYLAARYSRHEEMAGYAVRLRELGYDVQAEWITGAHHDTPDAECAEIDYNQVVDAEVFITFTEPPEGVPGRGRGGRHVEFGIAIASCMRVIVVGYRENVFHHLPEVEFYESVDALFAALAG